MPYELIHRAIFKNFEGQTVILHISDTTSGQVNPTTYTEMTNDDDQCLIQDVVKKVLNGNEKKTGIRGTYLSISFVSSETHNVNTFIDGDDNRWLVEVFIENTSNNYFTGYLVTDQNKEKFLPYGTHVVELTATCGLGALKDQILTKPDGSNPDGKFKLIEYISWCLQKTYHEFNIKVVNNLFEENYNGADHATYDTLYLWSKSFEAEINECENCYDVLEKITHGCAVFLEGNTWWIIRVDEINGDEYRIYNFSYDGTFTGTETADKYKYIGALEDIKLINKDADVYPERSKQYVKPIFYFEFPKEIPDNKDFSRGVDDLSPIVVDMGLYIKTYATLGDFPTAGEFDTTYKASGTGNYYKWNGTTYVQITGDEIPIGIAYVFEDWTAKKGNPDSPSSSTSTAYIAKITQYGDEKERYAVLTCPTVASTSRSYMESNAIPVHRQDKFLASVDFRFPTNITNGGFPFYVIMAIRLKGEDGSNWWLGHQVDNGEISPDKWYQSNTTWANWSFLPGPAVPVAFNGDGDTREWQSCSWDAPPCPVNGDLYIQLCAMNAQSNTLSTWDDTDIHYSGLQFQYIPYINGSYQKYTGQYHKVSVDDNKRANIEERVSVSDSPKKLFKGGLWINDGGYRLAGLFYNYNAGVTGELELAKYGKYQAFELWNQNNRVIRRFQGSLLGLDSLTPTDMPGLTHRYRITTDHDHTNDKWLMLLSYNQSIKTCKWDAVFSDVFDDNAGKDYSSDHEFKFLTGNE